MNWKPCIKRLANPSCAGTLREGFSLIEMLVVVFIIALLLALSFPVLSTVRRNAVRSNVLQLARQTTSAWNALLLEHRHWPNQRYINAVQDRRLDDSRVRRLLGVSGNVTPQHRQNLFNRVQTGLGTLTSANGHGFAMTPEVCLLLNLHATYLEVPDDMAEHGLLDHWGQIRMRDGNPPEATEPWQLRVALDWDYDGTIEMGEQTVRATALAWSVGEDGISGTENDIGTWARTE